MTKFVVLERNRILDEGPLGWPKAWIALADDERPPPGAEVWTAEERAAWEADPARKRELAEWEASRPEPEPPTSPKRITILEFLKRLPTERLAQIIKTTRELSLQGEPMPDTFLTLICAAQEIDLDDSEVLNGLEVFRQMGLITSEEKDILLGKKEPLKSLQTRGLALYGEIK